MLDRDILAKLAVSNQVVIQHLTQYSNEEWRLPSLVAWETYKSKSSRPEMQQAQRKLRSSFDRIIDVSDDVTLEAAYLDEKLQSQGVDMPPVDLLNLATAYTEGGTFATHNKLSTIRRSARSPMSMSFTRVSRPQQRGVDGCTDYSEPDRQVSVHIVAVRDRLQGL